MTSQKFQKYHNSTCSGWKWWQSSQSGALNNVRRSALQKLHQQGINLVAVVLVLAISVIWISRQPGIPPDWNPSMGGHPKNLYLLIMRPPLIKSKVPIMFLVEFCMGWAIKPNFAFWVPPTLWGRFCITLIRSSKHLEIYKIPGNLNLACLTKFLVKSKNSPKILQNKSD